MTANVPESPFIITSLSASLDCAEVTITITLKYPKALTLRILKGKPRSTPQGPEDPPSGRPHRINWTALIDRIDWTRSHIESTTHTFTIPWPAGQQVLYFQINPTDLRNRPTSRLPFITVTRVQEVIFYEPWGPALNSNNSWNQGSMAGTTITVSPGRMSLSRPNISGNPQLTTSLPASPSGVTPTNCNVTVYAAIYAVLYEIRDDSYIRIGTSSTSSRFAFNKINNVPNTADGNNSWTRQVGSGAIAIWNPNQIFQHGAAYSPNHLQPPPPTARAIGINITIDTFNNNFPSGFAFAEFGPIVATVDTAEATILRSDWRTYEPPSPFQPVGTIIGGP